MARMPETLRNLISGDGSFSDRLIDWIDDLVDPHKSSKNPFKRAFIFEPLEERVVLNAAPTFVDLPEEITIVVGESYHLALNGEDADDDDLTFSTSSDLATVLTGNESGRMRIVQRDEDGNIIKDFGYITFEFFDGDVSTVTERIKELIREGFYEDLTFHRIIDGFMIQGGDPDGDGTGGTGEKFNDVFNELLRHNRNGMFSMANSGYQKDAQGNYILDENGDPLGTNDSQFFITDSVTKWLDDAHSIFAFLTSGYDVLEEVSKVETTPSDGNPANRPLFDVIMEEVEVFNDTKNGTLRIQTDASMANTTQIVKVMVDDGNGNLVEREIRVNVVPTIEDLQFEETEIFELRAGESIIVDFPALANIPSSQIEYYVSGDVDSHEGMKYEITEDNRLKITADKSVSGIQKSWINFYSALDNWIYNVDSQGEAIVSWMEQWVVVLPAAPEVTWTDGDNGEEGDGITSNNNKDDDTSLTFTVEGIVPGATVKLYANGVEVPFKIVDETCYDSDGNVVANNSQEIARRVMVIRTAGSAENKLNDGTFNFTVKQFHYQIQLGTTLESELSTPIRIVIATVAPQFISPPEGFLYDATPGEELVIEVKTNKDDSEDITITFEGDVPEGMQYNAEDRTITWTPDANIENGDYTFTLKLTDGAGNTRTTTATVAVQSGPKFDVVGNLEADEETTVILELTPSAPVEGEDAIEGDLHYEIESSTLPEGADVSLTAGDDGQSALFRWATLETDGPGVYTVTFKVTDEDGNVRRKMIQLTVKETNTSPYFDAEDFEEEYHVKEHEQLVINVKARDDDVPKNAMTYQIVGESSILEGLAIDAATGKLTWTPGEQYGGQTYTITVEATDEAGATAEYSIRIVIEETDDPPVFTEMDTISVFDDIGDLVWDMEAVDPDIPTKDVRYSLVGDVPEGMTINALTGEIKWTIPAGYAGSENQYTSLKVEVKATEISETNETDENGNVILAEGLSSSYIVTLDIFSREYENHMEQIAGSYSQRVRPAELPVPGLPRTIADPLQFRDVPGSSAFFNMQRANAAVESPSLDPNENTMFRDRFDTVSFGDDILGSAENTSGTKAKPKAPAENELQPTPENEQVNHRSRKPIPSGAILRGMESGLSRLNTPLLDALNNVDVGQTVSEIRDAGQTIHTYYSNTVSTENSSHDAAMRDWNAAGTTGHSQSSASGNVDREQFRRSLRLE